MSEKLIIEQSGEIFGVSQINWEDSSWKYLSLVSDEEVISLSHVKVYVFSDSVLCLEKMKQNPTSNTVWAQQLDWFTDSPQCRTLDTIDGEMMEFEWNIFPGFTTLQLADKVRTNYRHVDVQWHHMVSYRFEVNANASLVSLFAKKIFQLDVGHSSDLDQKRSGILLTTKDHEENGTQSLNWWWSDSEKADTQSSEVRAHWHRGTFKSKGGGKLWIHLCADGDTIETVFRTIISVNQPSIYGAVSDLCEEHSTCQTRTGRPVLAGQSDPLFAPANLLIITIRPSIEILAQGNLLQK